MMDLSSLTALIQAYPRTGIIVLSFLVTLFITIISWLMTDKQKMREIRDRQKSIRDEMKNHKNNPNKLMELQQEMLKDFPEQMKHSFKPMIVTLIPIIIIFAWFKNVFTNSSLGGWWVLYYIAASMVFSLILRKLFKMN